MYPVWPMWMGSSIPVAVWLYPSLIVITLLDFLPAFFFHLVVVTLTLILRNLHRQQLLTESLELRLDREIEKRESERRDRRRR